MPQSSRRLLDSVLETTVDALGAAPLTNPLLLPPTPGAVPRDLPTMLSCASSLSRSLATLRLCSLICETMLFVVW